MGRFHSIVALIFSVLVALLMASGALARQRAPRPAIIGVASVIDGDTIEIHSVHYRLWGIDAPESGQWCGRSRMGQQSANALANIIGDRTVSCEDRGSGGWNRRVAYCTVAGYDLQAGMVRDGWAYAFSKYSHDYEAIEATARGRNLGIWAAGCQAPWDWRAERRKKS